jgi:hypothetical protein
VTRTAAPEKIETVSIGESPESIVEKWGDPNSVDTKSRYSYYSRSYSYTKQWEYKSIAGHTLTTTCLLSFRDQRLTGYSGCPALRIEFHEAGAYIADTPRLRVARMDSKNTVLSSWGLPTRVSLDSANATETWLYRDDRLTSGNCEIKFLSGSVVDYSAGCRLGYLAHWTF